MSEHDDEVEVLVGRILRQHATTHHRETYRSTLRRAIMAGIEWRNSHLVRVLRELAERGMVNDEWWAMGLDRNFLRTIADAIERGAL